LVTVFAAAAVNVALLAEMVPSDAVS